MVYTGSNYNLMAFDNSNSNYIVNLVHVLALLLYNYIC